MATLLNEEVAAQLWLLNYLQADAELAGMVNTFALKTTFERDALPYVKIDRQDSDDLMAIGMHRVWSDLTFLVRGITEGGGNPPDWAPVQAIANRIDAVLHRASGSTATIQVGEVWREEAFTDETIEGGDHYLHAGGIYRAHVYAL
jgi:hypothetical protein